MCQTLYEARGPMASRTELVPTLPGASHVVSEAGRAQDEAVAREGLRLAPPDFQRPCRRPSVASPASGCSHSPLSPAIPGVSGPQCRLMFGIQCQSLQCQQQTRGVCFAADKAPCQHLLCHTECQPWAAASPCPPFSVTPLPAPNLRRWDSQVGASFAIF